MASRKLIVEVVGDSRSLERTFDRSTKASKVFGREVTGNVAKADGALQKLGKGRAGLFAAGAGFGIVSQQITAQLGAAVDVASNLQEQIARSNVVFGSSAKAIEAWSKTTADSMGIAQDQALEAAGTFGAMFDQAGLASSKGAEFSKVMVGLASDLASFNNASIEDTLVAIRSGLSGEIEPLRRFQVFLTEAAVSQRAMEQSGKSNVKQLTQGEKILARYSLILEQTGKQQGDYARTSDSLANTQRKLSAQTRDLQANIGALLLPAMKNLTAVMSELVDFTGLAVDGLKALGSVKVPEIEIPFFITVGGKSLGDLTGDALGVLKRTPLNPLLGITIANDIADQFRDQAEDAQPKLTADVQAIIDGMMRNAFSPTAGTRGFDPTGTGLVAGNVGDAIRNAIEAAQGEAAKAIKTGKGRIAAEKAAEDAAKAADALADRLAKESARRAAARAAEQVRQFRALGLDASGLRPPPTIANLLKQITQLKGTDLSKNERGVLARIRKVLVDPLKKATPETRAAAKGLIDGMRDELDVDKKLVGPLTKTTSLRANKLIEGLGLGPAQIRELRARLSSFNSAGLANAGTLRPSGTFRGGITVENHNTVELDGQVVGRNVTRSQQKTRKRNPVQKRGSRRGGI